MSWTSFFTSLRPQKRISEPQDLPLSSRLDTLEGDMHNLRGAVDSMQGTLRKLSGKIYRGVPLVETTDVLPVGQLPDEPDIAPGLPMGGKADLYNRAAQLRRR